MNSIFSNTNISTELMDRLRAMPKVELHVHLEGATSAATVWELAQRNHISLPEKSPEAWQASYSFRDFNHFIEIYQLAAECMRTPEDFAYMVQRFLERQAEHHVKYCEVFLSASLMLDKFPQTEVITVLKEELEKGEEYYGVRARFIPDITRHTPETRFQVLDFVLAGRDQGIFIGLGLGGKEVGFPPELFKDVFEEARRHGLHVVAHAGENGGPQSIWGAIRSLRAERIGHGVRAVEDLQLVRHLAQIHIPLEICPYSNYRLKVVPLDQPHPIRALMDQGVYVTVNSDDPPMFSTDLSSEYLLLARQGFGWDELWQLNLNALEASFLTDEEKTAYRIQWQAFASQQTML
ncbi:adenosine deaminase [Pelolinea submarina]|uniref:Adenosine deaminase/aminodeoxyfutalosine deaminase n=1 Tax=Pelolinea submarina TaxID=913107 RepID=A0A347ZWK6_9CHLR|nr:adenosine deaminase [Pelolinea submarina]REG05429.1 adenosine deaminase/aminodeoxyfutalosine deaminase [Pelolinea submarina]BBB49687.1 adenosine deaminase [Pelolinea submarina]